MPFNEVASKAQSVLVFATHLQRLLARDANLPSQAISDILPYIQALPLPRKDIAPNQRIEFDRAGVVLWNTCCRLGKTDEDLDKKNLATIRAFSYFLVESAASSKGKSTTTVSQSWLGSWLILRRYHPTVQTCTQSGQMLSGYSSSSLTRLLSLTNTSDAALFDIGSKIVEQLASNYEDLSHIKPEEGESEEQVVNDLGAQYLLVRVALAWKQDRAELTDHFYAQLETSHPLTDAKVVGELIDLCYEIGNDQLHRNQSAEATKWLKRGCQWTDRYKSHLGDPDMDGSRLTLLHTYARALLSTPGAYPGEEVRKALDVLHEEFGNKLCVSLLQLEVYADESAPNVDAFLAELSNMIRTAHLIPTNHKSIMHYIHHLRSLSVGHAMKALEMYITTRLATDDENLWTENAVITLIWMMATPLQMTFVVPPDFQDTLDRILQTWKSVLSPAAAHAALVFIWKAVEHTIDEDQWCQFALHEMFKNAGDGNIGKVERTLIQFHLDQSNVDAAHDVWEKMSPARKRHDLSRYLQYCIALRRGDDTAVWSALTSLATVHDDRNKLLFVAVSKAMKYGTNAQTAQLLHRILEKYKDRLPAEVDAFALSRCTARLLIRALEENDKPSDELLSRLCAVFKSALLLLQRQDTTEARCTASILADCKWFEQASFTCAISNWKSWPARFVIDLLQYSCETQYPPNSPGESQIEKFLHEVTTSFAQAALYTAEARSASADWTIEDLPRSAYSSKSPPLPANIKKTLYRHVFDKSTNLKRRYNELQRDWPDATPAMLEDVGRQVVAVSPLALEAMLFLGSHEHAPVAELSLNQIIDQAIQLRPTTRQYSSLVDMVLCAASVVPIQGDVNEEVRRGSRLSIITATQLLAKLIQGVRSHSDYATPEASRWIRCVVQIALDGRGSDKGLVSAYDEKALKTLDMITHQALILARSGSEDDIPGRDNRNQYPSEELEWLSTTLFNLSIDLYISQMELRSAAEEPVVDSSEESTESKSDLMQPQMWAAKAVEFADILARPVQLSDGQENAAVAEGADWGMLARVLRDRCKGFGWHV